MNIRPAHPGESEELSALALASKALWDYSPQQLLAWAGELRITPESIVAEPTFVAEEDDRLVGVIQLGREPSHWTIDCLWVHPSAVRRGVGTALLRHALAHARSQGHAELHVDADPNAEAFYLQLGARKAGEIAAPIEGQPGRVRPQLILDTGRAA